MRAAARQVLAELELCSATRARTYAPVVSGAHAGSRPPTGGESAAARWRERFANAEPCELAMLVRLAHEDLAAIKRRRFPVVRVRDGDDLRRRIVDDGAGLPALEVAIALRCTPTLVRKTRLSSGRDPDRGTHVLVGGDPVELVAAGLSIRAASAATGVPRSTLAGRLARAADNHR